MPDGRATSRVYQSLWRQATTAPPHGPRFRSAASRELRIIASPPHSLAQLSEQFSRDDLAAAGVAEMDADGRLAPAPTLRGEGVEIIALRERADAAPYDLLTARGCLNGETTVGMLGDYRWRQRSGESSGYVYLAFSWDDWLWLEAAGQAALYCPAVDQLTVSLVRRLTAGLRTIGESPSARGATSAPVATADAAAERFGDEPANAAGPACALADATALDRPACEDARGGAAAPTTNAPTTDEPPECAAGGPAPMGLDRPSGASRFALVIVAWSPSMHSAAEPPGLSARLAELAEWEQVAGNAYGGMDVIVWRPGAEELRRLELIDRHGDCETLADALAASVESWGHMLSSLAASPPPPNFLEARAAYRRALLDFARRSDDQAELQTTQHEYDRHLQGQLIEPLLKWGAELLDPRERARCAAMAETCDLLFRLAPHVGIELNEFASRGGSLARSLSRGGGLQTFVMLAKAFAAFSGKKD